MEVQWGFRFGSDLVLGKSIFGSDLVPNVIARSVEAQVWFKFGSDLVLTVACVYTV